MINQTNEAAERSAHVTRGEKPAPAEWPVVRMPDGTWKLKSVVALEARIAELEAALAGITAWVAEWTDHVGSCSHKNETCTCGRAFNLHEARAALAGGKDGRD